MSDDVQMIDGIPKRCKCGVRLATKEQHACPFQADVHNDPAPCCDCCDECEQECCDDI